MRILNDHPISLGLVNKRVLDAVNIAYRVASKLAARGYIVKGISATSEEPTILLHANARCQKLNGSTQKIIRNKSGIHKFFNATVDGCVVVWQQSGVDACSN